MCAAHWRLLGSVYRKAIVDEWHCMNSSFHACLKCPFMANDASEALQHGSASGHPIRIRKDHDHQAIYDAAVADAAQAVNTLLSGTYGAALKNAEGRA